MNKKNNNVQAILVTILKNQSKHLELYFDQKINTSKVNDTWSAV